MADSANSLRLILGVKLKLLRQERGFTLRKVADRAGISISYLSEIEKGKKYPKPGKLIGLASALGVPYDDLVSLKVDEPLEGLREVIYSPFLRAFPFELFGVEPKDVVSLMAGVPRRASALIRAFIEVSRTYDARVEHFLFAALRAHQKMHGNHFPEIENAASEFRKAQGWGPRTIPDAATLRTILEKHHGYTIDTATLPEHETLHAFRSIVTGDDRRTMFVNGSLRDEQQAFLYARELGFLTLKPATRPTTGSWVKVESFEQVLANFEASYFAGAVLIPAAALDEDLTAFFRWDTWDEAAFRRALRRYRATPEMFFYRLTQRIPEVFGLKEIFFMRFHHNPNEDTYDLTKVLNMSRVPVPHGIQLHEHYCRRWPGMQALSELARNQADPESGPGQAGGGDEPVVAVQRSHFLNDDAEFFVIAVARPLALKPGTNTVVMLGFLMDRAFKRAVRFWVDPAIPRVDVNLTCERCPLTDCNVRAAEPSVLREQQRLEEQEKALEALRAEGSS